MEASWLLVTVCAVFVCTAVPDWKRRFVLLGCVLAGFALGLVVGTSWRSPAIPVLYLVVFSVVPVIAAIHELDARRRRRQILAHLRDMPPRAEQR